MQVFPTAPSPTVTHFMNLDALISSDGSKKVSSDLRHSANNQKAYFSPKSNSQAPRSCRGPDQILKWMREREREREIDDFDDD